jgi:F-type H+-transporting ATPase subunit gamma
MSGTSESLRRKIAGAKELGSVVRSMKALAASSVGQYESAVQSLSDYYRTVELGLAACFRRITPAPQPAGRKSGDGLPIGAIVFGSDQGLVGRFNEVLLEFAAPLLAGAEETRTTIWAVGERVHALLVDAGHARTLLLPVPASVDAITGLVDQLLIAIDAARERGAVGAVHVFHNRPKAAALYEPVGKRLLPLDLVWRGSVAALPWPTALLPEVVAGRTATATLQALIREYLFVVLFQASAESLASENASRLAAMQRAEKNIGNILEELNRRFHRLRQQAIDEELFDVVAGYEAQRPPAPRRSAGQD